MAECEIGDFAAAGGAFDETFLYEIGLVDFLDRARIFAKSRGDGRQADRSALELRYNGREYLVVDLIETLAVDIERLKGITGNHKVDRSVAFDLGEVADATQQGVGDSGCAAAPQCYLGGGFGRYADV